MYTILYCLYIFSDPIPGKLILPVSGTRWNVEDQDDPLQVK